MIRHTRLLTALLVASFLSGCYFQTAPPLAGPGQIAPGTRTPAQGPTPKVATATFFPSPSATSTATPAPSPTPTLTPSPTSTPTQTLLPPPEIIVVIQTCDTGIDIRSGLGEVTNAYITIQNVSETGATGMVAVLEANDEGQAHSNKSYHIGYLPGGTEISIKLTVDTQNGVDTSLTVTITTAEGVTATASTASCRSRQPDQDIINSLGELFTIHEIEPKE